MTKDAFDLLNVAEEVALHATHLIAFVRFYASVSGKLEATLKQCILSALPLIGSTYAPSNGWLAAL